MKSTATTPPGDELSEEEGTPDVQTPTKERRKRSSRACDQCRKTKSKCDRPSGSVACGNCQALTQECTFLGPSRKRGPPKGYITALETRVHRLEALWGVLLSCSDPRAQTLVADLAQDGLSRNILGEVETGAFGPIGRTRILQTQDSELPDSGPNSARGFTSSRARREQYLLGNEADASLPSYQWQDRLAHHIVARGISRRQGEPNAAVDIISAPYAFAPEEADGQTGTEYGLALPPVKEIIPSLGSFSLATRRPQDAEMIWHALYDPEMPSSDEESEYSSDDPADAIGQLSLNEKEQVGYLGKTSGMHLLAKPRRSDSLNAGGIWHLPQSRFLPEALRGRPIIEEDLQINVSFPPQEVQNQLLDSYWTYVQPVLPVLDKAKFLAEYSGERMGPVTSEPTTHSQLKLPNKVPRLLLLSMFTIAARYSGSQPQVPEGNMWEAGCDFLETAKMILNWTYDSPRPSTCQALILLAYREFGIGAISQAWIYMGMAIRMATDLGMHRAADRWQRSGRILFTEAEKSSRKRLWYCCIILDRIMAFAMGRPMCIRERDYDTALPSIEEDEENEVWISRSRIGHSPRPVLTLSTLNTTASLSSILALIVDTIYACRSGISFVARHIDSFRMAAMLQDWYHKIPERLHYDLDVDKVVPLPHVLTLHMMYWCAVLLVHRPFIRHHKHTLTHTGIAEDEIGAMSEKSLAHSTHAASRVSSLVHVYCKTWDMSRANAFVSWYVLSAGVMHVATLTMHLGDEAQARLGLQRCLEAFDKMKVVWPSSARAWQLLRGAELDLSVTPSSSMRPDVSQLGLQPQPSDFAPVFVESKAAHGPSDSYSYLPFDTAPVPTHQPPFGSFPSLTTTMGQNPNGPAPNMSYFPGYDHWPPESLVFDPPFLDAHAEDRLRDDDGSTVQMGLSDMNRYDLAASMDAHGLTVPMDMFALNETPSGTGPSSVAGDHNGVWQ